MKELSERLLHGEVESLVAMLLEVRDEAQGRDNRLLEEALERGRETLHKAIQDRADMQARTAKLAQRGPRVGGVRGAGARVGHRRRDRCD